MSLSPEVLSERRVCERYPVRIQVGCSPISRAKRRSTPRRVSGLTRDLSLVGAGIELANQKDLKRGSRVTITIGQSQCQATIKTIRAGHNQSHKVYGVEFRDPHVIDVVGNLIGGSGFNRRLAGDPLAHRSISRSDDQHYFDRLRGRSVGESST